MSPGSVGHIPGAKFLLCQTFMVVAIIVVLVFVFVVLLVVAFV